MCGGPHANAPRGIGPSSPHVGGAPHRVRIEETQSEPASADAGDARARDGHRPAGGAGRRGRLLGGIFRGDAWGTVVKQHQGIRSGHSAPATLSCLTVPGKTYHNEVTAVHAPQNIFDTGAVVDTAQSLAGDDGSVTARTTSVIHNLSIAGGVVQAETI